MVRVGFGVVLGGLVVGCPSSDPGDPGLVDPVDDSDRDGDGFVSILAGGDDCNDGDPAVYPGAEDLFGDGVDADCDGFDGVDSDEDGHSSIASGGDDCDDTDPRRNPSFDGDRDGASSCDDCDDADPFRSPDFAEVCDGVDVDCDGTVDFADDVDLCARLDAGLIGASELDVLMVVDNSCSMASYQDDLVASADDFVAPLVDAYALRVGVVTMDMFNPFDSGRLRAGPDGRFFADETDDLASATTWLAGTLPTGSAGAASEQPLEASMEALGPLAKTANVGFARATAQLAIVFVTSDGEDDTLTVSDWQSWFDAYVSGRPSASVHAIASPTDSTRVSNVATANQGLVLDIDDDMSVSMGQVAATLPAASQRVVLSELPDPTTIVATVVEPGGSAVVLVQDVDYVYDAALNAVVLTGFAPVSGSELVVTYRVQP